MAGLNTYATLTAFHTRQGLATTDTNDDARMLAKLRAASAQIERYSGRVFYPSVASHKFDCPRHGSLTLLFKGYDLLELTTLTNGDGTTTIPSTDYNLLEIHTPYYGLELDATRNYFYYLTVPTKAITVLGVWGYHDDYDNTAWKDSGDTVQNAISISATNTALTVANNALNDAWGLTPRFQAGQLIRIGTEYCHVLSVSSNTVTIARAANGSTGAVHLNGVAIYTYVPPADISELCLAWAAWLYKIEDAGNFDSTSNEKGVGGVKVGKGIPDALLSGVMNYQRVF